LHYSSAAAADDLEALRQAWQVPGLAILGIGTGARTALAYAGSHPGHVSLLALDSPAPLDGDQETAARAALGGSDAALRLWAASCTHDECGPGDPDEKVDAISRAIADARSDGAPGPAAMLSDVVRAALGDISGSSAPEPSEGDEILGSLVREGPDRTPAPVRSSATRLAASSLPFVAGCSDLSRRVPVDRVGQLSSEWADEQPFGPVLAAQVSACSTWPVPAPAPVELPSEAPVLLLSGIADPVAGAAPLEPTAAILTAAGAPEVRTVTWGAPGSRVVLHSACARSAVVKFMDDPAAGDGSAACPSRRSVAAARSACGRVASTDGSLLTVPLPSRSTTTVPRLLCHVLWPLAVMSVIHRVLIRAVNGSITNDFGTVYTAARNFLAGEPVYGESLLTVQSHYLYARSGALLLSAFGLIDNYTIARWLFIIVNAAAILVALWLLMRLFYIDVRSCGAPALILAAFCTEAVTNTLVFTNVNGVIFLSQVAFLYLLHRRRLWWSGAAIGVSLAIKPMLAPLLVLPLIRRQWQPFVGALAIPAATMAAGWALTVDAREYLDKVAPY